MKRFVEAYNPETRDWYVTDRRAPGGAPVPDGSIREAQEVARKLNAHEEMLDALETFYRIARSLGWEAIGGKDSDLFTEFYPKAMAALTGHDDRNTTGGEK